MSNSQVLQYRLGFKPSVLPTESEDEFYVLYSALERHINPTNPIKEMLLNEIAASLWETIRMHKWKSASLTVKYASAIPNLFDRVGISNVQEGKAFARSWFTSQDGKKVVKDLLEKFGLDEKAIEAVALERAATSYLLADKLQSSSTHRRDRALQNLVDFGDAFGGSKQQDANDSLQEPDAEQSAAEAKPEAA